MFTFFGNYYCLYLCWFVYFGGLYLCFGLFVFFYQFWLLVFFLGVGFICVIDYFTLFVIVFLAASGFGCLCLRMFVIEIVCICNDLNFCNVCVCVCC